jgi:beta-1,4-N-acetylglucosaminyltransferase
MNTKTKRKVCLISSSGGHYEQLKMLHSLEEENELVWITEKTDFVSKADYYLFQTGSKDKLFLLKMSLNLFKSLKIWFKEKPDYVVTTGAMIVIPMALIAKVFGKKVVYIETFARVHGGTRTGRLMYKFADLFIIQWEPLKKVYPKAIYGGGIY